MERTETMSLSCTCRKLPLLAIPFRRDRPSSSYAGVPEISERDVQRIIGQELCSFPTIDCSILLKPRVDTLLGTKYRTLEGGESEQVYPSVSAFLSMLQEKKGTSLLDYTKWRQSFFLLHVFSTREAFRVGGAIN